MVNTKIRVGAVSYLNTSPLIYGFRQKEVKDQIDLVMDYPASIADMLINDQIDIGLVPVSIIPQLHEHYIISDYCISSDGETGSVALFSDVPLSGIEKVLLDYQSRTSVELVKILIKEWWKIDPVIEAASHDYRGDIHGTTAGLVIGDRAFEQKQISAYMFDLGLEWKKFTGLPFVFATWISNKKLEPSFIEFFNSATAEGLSHIDEIVAENAYPLFDLKAYYTTYINYHLQEHKKKAMEIFLEKAFPKVLT